MGVEKLLKEKYFMITFELQQRAPAKLPYYGPMIHGWLADAIYQDETLWKIFFRNPKVDVRPYFFWTETKGNTHYVRIVLLKPATRYVRDLVELIGVKQTSKLNGEECEIKKVRYEEIKITPFDVKEGFVVQFLTPLSLMKDGKILYRPPTLSELTKATIRSVNRFCKYFYKDAYPIHTKKEPEEGDIRTFEIAPYTWEYRRKGENKRFLLSGIRGQAVYSIKESNKEIGKILSLLQVFQIGKWLSYGFGKVEVNT
jgi:CRISPR/Cas system endoribonuclease Cas6 (RAMP superfamily)